MRIHREKIEFLKFATGKTVPILALEKSSEYYGGLAVSPDGRSLLYNQLDFGLRGFLHYVDKKLSLVQCRTNTPRRLLPTNLIQIPVPGHRLASPRALRAFSSQVPHSTRLLYRSSPNAIISGGFVCRSSRERRADRPWPFRN